MALNLHAPRYCSTPFPAYRYVPGRNPHPTADARGHSYLPPGEQEPTVELLPPERWRESVEYLFGCDLYNHAYWWEAHEAWEGLWRVAGRQSVQGRFLQGLIQTSACHLKRYLGHPRGVARLRSSARGYLTDAAEAIDGRLYMGLDLPAFIDAVNRYYDRVDADETPPHDPEGYPYIRLDLGAPTTPAP